MINSQKGSLSSLLSSIIVALWLIAGVSYLTYINSSIEADKTKQLDAMLLKVKNTNFEKPFNEKVKYLFVDGKITNSEFADILELYANYKTSKVLKEDSAFIEKTEKSLVVEKQFDFTLKKLLIISAAMVFIFMSFIVGFRSLKG